MDWSKAKNILIIAFIITNLILIYVLTEKNDNYNSNLTLEEDFVIDVEDKLLEKDIRIDCNIPKEFSAMALLPIQFETYEPTEIAGVFLKEFDIIDKDGIKYYKSNNEILTIIDNKEIVYEDNSPNKKYNKIDEKDMSYIVDSFLKDKGLYKEDYKLTDHRVKNDQHILEYTKIYNGIFIEESYMKFEIDSTGIKKFERKWINPGELNDEQITIRSAPDALLRLLSREEAYGKTITDISLCYYFMGDPKNTKGGHAVPAWRIKFDDGTKIFLEEY